MCSLLPNWVTCCKFFSINTITLSWYGPGHTGCTGSYGLELSHEWAVDNDTSCLREYFPYSSCSFNSCILAGYLNSYGLHNYHHVQVHLLVFLQYKWLNKWALFRTVRYFPCSFHALVAVTSPKVIACFPTTVELLAVYWTLCRSETHPKQKFKPAGKPASQ